VVKFLHTADWHLGIGQKQLFQQGEKAREIRKETLQNLMKIAKQKRVDFIIVAGDLFHCNDVSLSAKREALEVFKVAAPIPLFILPGNHDPLGPNYPCLDPIFAEVKNLNILKKEEPLETVPNVILFPCPLKQKRSRFDPTEWIPKTEGKISIGIAHGNLKNEKFSDNFPIDPDRVEKSGLDYLALGEWHGYLNYGEKNTVVYSGAPEATDFGEKNAGKAVIVEIVHHGSRPRLDVIEIGKLQWETKEKNISKMEDLERIELELENLDNPDYRIIRVNLKGLVDEEMESYLEQLEKTFSKKLFFLEFNRKELTPKTDFGKLRALMPEGVLFRKIIDSIETLKGYCSPYRKSRKKPSKSEESVSSDLIRMIIEKLNPTSEVLDRAIFLLYRMAKEVENDN